MVLEASDFRIGDVTTFEEKQVKEDESGNRSSVRKDVLKSTPLFNFYSDEAMKERKERVAYFQDKAVEAGKEKNDWFTKVKDLWSQMSGLDKSDEQYALLKDEYWAARFKKTAFGNQEFSNYMQAFMIASDPIA